MLPRHPAAVAFLLAISSLPLVAQQRQALWSSDAPGAPKPDTNTQVSRGGGVYDIYQPDFALYRPGPEKANGSAIVVFPGGGYGMLATGWEGKPIAEHFAALGFTAAVVHYRVSSDPSRGYQHPVPLLDAQRAVRTLRHRAAELGIERDRIGVIGFSAGGHLAATISNLHAEVHHTPSDAIDREDARPDFAVLVYPVISMGDISHSGSRKNLLGAKPTPGQATALSMESRVTSKTPPTFLVHGGDDAIVSALNSTAYYDACIRNKVPVELHLFEKGKHGFTLGKAGGAVSAWPDLLATWLGSHGFLSGARTE